MDANNTIPAFAFHAYDLTRLRTRRVFATVGAARFEFTSFRFGAWEVYDFPHAGKESGLPRFVGYAPASFGEKLLALVAADQQRTGQFTFGNVLSPWVNWRRPRKPGKRQQLAALWERSFGIPASVP